MKTTKHFVYDVAGFGELIAVRLTSEQIKMINKIIKTSRKIDGDYSYESLSEFIRGSTVKRIREERQRLKL